MGANDNGSGVAAVLELARILEGTDMPYNIKFILFSSEEKYMLGSRWYARNLPEDERKKIIGMINIDSIAEKSDHYPFALLDIPAVSIVQDWQEGLHVNDTLM